MIIINHFLVENLITIQLTQFIGILVLNLENNSIKSKTELLWWQKHYVQNDDDEQQEFIM